MADIAFVPESSPDSSGKTTAPNPGLLTPAASVGPDEERNRADQLRRNALSEGSKIHDQGGASANAGESVASAQGAAPTHPATTGSAEQGAAPTHPVTTVSPEQGVAPNNNNQATLFLPDQLHDVGPSKPSKKKVAGQPKGIGRKGRPDEKQRLQRINYVLQCDQKDYCKILGIPNPPNSNDQAVAAFTRMSFITNPKTLNTHDKTTIKRAEDACKRVREAGKSFTDKTIDEDNADFSGMEGVESTDSQNVVPRPEFLAQVYKDAEDSLADLSKKPNDSEIQAKLDKANKAIEERIERDDISVDKAQVLIDVKAISELFNRRKGLHEKLAQNPQDGGSMKELESVGEDFAILVQSHLYPERWMDLLKLSDDSGYTVQAKGPSPRGKHEVRAGFTWDGEPILACRKFMGGYRYYVEIVVNNYKTCDVRTADEIGPTASNAYLGWDQCVMVGEDGSAAGALLDRRKPAQSEMDS